MPHSRKPVATLPNRILKVNHAGEHGAVNIYRGQLLVCRWRATALIPELREFMADEERHRALFATHLAQRGLPRCRSYHLCGLGGFVLGFFSGLCGHAALAATTVAVERVVLRHLEAQLILLKECDPAAHYTVQAIVSDERAHHDRAALAIRQGWLWPRLLMPIVSQATESVIWLGMRV